MKIKMKTRKKDLEFILHCTIKKVGNDIETFNFYNLNPFELPEEELLEGCEEGTSGDDIKLVARALLPAEIAVGSKLKYEMLQYEMI